MNGDLLGYNLFLYCGNNPVRFSDDEGTFWDIAIDVVFTIGSVINVIQNPTSGKAWKLEAENVKNGGNGISRIWSNDEKIELITTGKVQGYHGHHMKSVNMYPSIAWDPNNIQFLTPAEHFKAHNYNWRNPTHGKYR